MGNAQEANAAASSATRAPEEDLPSYSASSPAGAVTEAGPAPRYQQHQRGESLIADAALVTDGVNHQGPTASDPFNFPDAPVREELPAYSAASGRGNNTAGDDDDDDKEAQKPIAIPQITPTYKAPFLDAYAPVLLKYGVPNDTWKHFLDAVSAFLTAKVSDRMLSHAADMGKQATGTPTGLLGDTVRHAKSVGKEIKRYHRKRNYLGAVFEIIGGAITIPIGAALNTAGAAITLPTSALGAIFMKPQTPYERAATYLAAANMKWFYDRGLHAMLLNTEEVSDMIGTSVTGLVGLARSDKRDSVEGLLGAMEGHIEKLEVKPNSRLDLGADTFWVVLVPFNYDEEVRGKEEEDLREQQEEEERRSRKKGKERRR
ncbi:hypothetical protein N3K66_004194 [Trichothecium roseum]|uniref:Uncharacterized protein n=1 Tax=Trichothecium roseum TaxID=47278 RepID=A0ACC0V0P1_9HYPO|nr:hypothetical protein N3K66_004194 [Trichothecium roseum]